MNILMITLTNERGEEFLLNAFLIERILPNKYRGGSEIILSNGNHILCIESMDNVNLAIDMAKV